MKLLPDHTDPCVALTMVAGLKGGKVRRLVIDILSLPNTSEPRSISGPVSSETRSNKSRISKERKRVNYAWSCREN